MSAVAKWERRAFLAAEVLLLALIVWATITEGPSVFGTIYVLCCGAIVEGCRRFCASLRAEGGAS